MYNYWISQAVVAVVPPAEAVASNASQASLASFLVAWIVIVLVAE